MCGRYASFREAEDLARAFTIDDLLADALGRPPSWNLAPTQDARIVLERLVEGAQRRELRLARWGLVPPWAKDPSIGARMINARAETLAEKPSFRQALAKRRCLVMADGYYEWQKDPSSGAKIPWYIYPTDGAPIAFAGLYELWREPPAPGTDQDSARWLLSTTIVTGPAVAELAHIHDRRPIALTADTLDVWLNPSLNAPQEALAILETPGPSWATRAISTRVNRVANNDPTLIEVVDDSPGEELPTLPGF